MSKDQSTSMPKTCTNGKNSVSPESKESTRERILDTALQILGRDGLQALTTRAIAREAGVNQALINYHFQTKGNLLLEMSIALDSDKYARQWTMYHETNVPLSQKWRQAIEFYRRDLADGYIRINSELQHIAITDPAIAASISERQRLWSTLLEEVAAQYLPPLGIHVPPAFIASTIASFWLGMNARLLVNQQNDDDHIFEILDFIGDWLEERERQYGVSPQVKDG